MRVGIVGLGRMGSAMAERLLDKDVPITVWNRSPERGRRLLDRGATLATSPRALTGAVDVVLTSLTDAAALASVYGGSDGLLAAPPAGLLLIDCSTVRPTTMIDLADRATVLGARFLECPVGGSVGPARSGQLLGFAGGGAADLAAARPLLDLLCRRIVHAGKVGAGSSLKLAVNLPLLVYWQALGEAFALCRSVELSPAELVDVLTDTSGAPPALKGRAAMVAAALGGDVVPGTTFDVDSIRKDLRTMLEEGHALDTALPLAAQALAVYDTASAAGLGAQDGAALPAYWARRAANGAPL